MKMRALPLADAVAVIDRLPAKYACVAAIGVTTGCRVSEILQLRRMDLLDERGRIRSKVKFVKLKTHDKAFRNLAIPPDFKKYLIRHLNNEAAAGFERPDDYVFRGQLGKPLSRLTVYGIFRSVLGRGYGTHWMRKTFAQLMYNQFLKLTGDGFRAVELTRQALGHAKIETTVKYLGIEENLIDTAQLAIFTLKGK